MYELFKIHFFLKLNKKIRFEQKNIYRHNIIYSVLPLQS